MRADSKTYADDDDLDLLHENLEAAVEKSEELQTACKDARDAAKEVAQCKIKLAQMEQI